MLWELILSFRPGEVAKATADKIFDGIICSFNSKNVSILNIMAITFDGCSTMIGQWNGLKPLLQTANPGMVAVRCPAHCTHLVIKHSLKSLPNDVMNFINDLFSIFKSLNKIHDFNEL